MQNSFFTQPDFNNNFGKEMASASFVYERRKESGIKDGAMAMYDFVFISDDENKIRLLGKFLSENYDYSIKEITKQGDYWELTGDSTEFPVDEGNLLYWGLDMYCKGYEFDCKLDGYGAIGNPNAQTFPDFAIELYDHYFNQAMQAYDRRNLGMAFINFSNCIKIDADDPNAWYSRAIVKDELYTWKSARRDYDKAIELAPDFIDAIVNRAANKDEAGEYTEAIEDYTTVIDLEPKNEMAYFNRGNPKFNIGDKTGACKDWHIAKALGADYSQDRINGNCK